MTFNKPLPKGAPEVESTFWYYDKVRDATGDDLGDLIKRAIYNIQNRMSNKRREILRVYPVNKSNSKHFRKLGHELSCLENVLHDKIQELHATVETDFQKPDYLTRFPVLKD